MEEWQKELMIDANSDKSFVPAKIIFYVFRHGKSIYIEELGPGSHQETGKWNQQLTDLTDDGMIEIKKSAEILGQEINSTNQIVTFFASPRARTIASAELIAQALKDYQIEIIDSKNSFSPLFISDILRSGGDFSALFDPKTNSDLPDLAKFGDLSETEYRQRINIATGLRFRKFLNFMVKYYFRKFPSPKTPTFIVISHNEVLEDFLQKLNIANLYHYPEENGIISPGAFFKIEIESAKAQELRVSFPDPNWRFESIVTELS